MDYKKLEVRDQTLEDMLHDEFVTKRDFHNPGGMQGVAVFKNRKGDVLMRKKNLVVLRGRIFTLQRLFCETDRSAAVSAFDIPTTSAASFFPDQVNVPTVSPWGSYVDNWNGPGGSFTNNVNRMLCMFRIGSGAYDVVNNPWTLVNPPHSYDLSLRNPKPFRVYDKTIPNWVNPISKLDPTNGNKTLEHIYPCKNAGAAADLVLVNDATDPMAQGRWAYKRVTGTGNVGEIQYLWKRFNCTTTDPYSASNFTPEWACHYGQNSAAVKMTLWLDEGDAEGEKINELGLYIANIASTAGQTLFRWPEMFSHITFETEPMHGSKDIKCEYYLFA
jgi:hypothetical protein